MRLEGKVILVTGAGSGMGRVASQRFAAEHPDEALEQCRAWESAGADQLTIGVGAGSHEGTLETIRLIGEHIIPKLDLDPVHRSSRMREAATR